MEPENVLAAADALLTELGETADLRTDLALILLDRGEADQEALADNILNAVLAHPEALARFEELLQPHPSRPGKPLPAEATAPASSALALRASGDSSECCGYPRIDAPGEVVEGWAFYITVGLSPEIVASVSGGPMRGTDSPLPVTVTVQTIADGFTLDDDGSWSTELRVTETDRYPSHALKIRAVADERRVRPGWLHVVYSVGGEVVGMGFRSIAVVKDAAMLGQSGDSADQASRALLLPRGDEPADLTVTIVPIADRPGRFLFSYQSPHVRVPGLPEECDVGQNAAQYASAVIQRVAVREKRPDLLAFMTGLGREITDVMPTNLWTILSSVAKAVAPRVPAVLIQSAEAYMPWELAVVPEPTSADDPAFLGSQVSLGRWVLSDRRITVPPPMVVRAASMTVISGVYETEGWQRLFDAEMEAATLVDSYGATELQARLADVISYLEHGPIAGIVHFAGHGQHDEGGWNNGLVMTDGHTLDPTTVKAYDFPGETFVFLNACKAAAVQGVFGGYAGLVQAFLYVGASAVVSPLWALNDCDARCVALSFYQRVLAGEKPAEVMRSLRAAASGNAELAFSAMAYQFFGHPHMQVERVGQFCGTEGDAA
ncbi:CHAT domain-containing protein [Streptomyces gilvifuscus]|uniref:CHAT domain-containing protein n=1 Tax=Streptomyces gilvifuscus TaxID=1550617 RepID=A0ABT5FWI6_9ACTN|nr:CHAT domain-containing protein [Streptomyces gilvifuscus]MDC2956887.1 CHAT domain-containing protein [Streptomyces gilvifuscus]